MKLLFFLGCICLALFMSQSLSSCKKFKPFSQEHIYFSKDTVVFDTVFTTVGSTTQQFKIYNPSNKAVKIEEIELMGGTSSPFRMNVDGEKGTSLGEMVLEGKDSLFAFVEVTLSVNGQNLPLIIEDSIRFRTNGKDHYVKLAVWGQDAYFHYKDLNEGTWPNDKPHVIYGYAAVDSSKTLTIPAGTNIYMHKNALLYVYKGALQVQGMLNQEVVFQGDRLESMYDEVPGQYYGIYFHEALPSNIDYAIIKNGTAGVHLYHEAPTNTGYTLQLTNTRIFNMSRYGVFIYSGAKVRAENCIVSRNETHALLVLEGGDFNFNHCNLLGYGSAKGPSVGISNYYSNPISGITNVGSIHEGTFSNCVLYGNNDFNLAIDTLHMSGVTLNFQFSNCLIRSDSVFSDPYFTNVLWNQNPLFENTAQGDFLYLPNSPLNGNGLNTGLALDIFGNPRQNPPDIGAVEL